ncbi:MAG: endonuclease [Flavobacteriales bacterium]|nr:endonuclease [Flavobacteriales bacterium]MDW8433026.1 endonuclease [Flavobacteriales bacterium]
MKSSIFFTFSAFLAGQMLNAQQAPVPTSWGCEGSTPAGWTLNLGSNPFYASSSACAGSGSLRLDASGEWVMVEFGSQPGPITFSLRGMVGTAPVWDGTFRVQESVNGTNWVTISTFQGPGSIPHQACTTLTATPANPLTRYIRFWLENKISGNNATGGGNVNLDEISVALPIVTTAELKVNQNSTAGTEVFNGGVSDAFGTSVGNTLPVTFVMQNYGTVQTLTISSITLGGPNSSEFSIVSPTGFPLNIGPQNTQNLVINFTPSGTGTRLATVTIQSNDATDPAYTFTLYGVGGTLASEPTASATNLSFTNVKTFRYNVNYTAASPGPDILGGYLVLRKTGSPVTETPVDGVEYQRGQSIGQAKVVYKGKGTGFVPLDIVAGTTYHFSVFTYNGNGNFTNYKTNAPLTGQVTTPNTLQPANEYASVDVNSPNFISQLTSVINPHQSIFYSNYAVTMINKFAARDTYVVQGPNVFTKAVLCSYSNDVALYNDPFDFAATGWSREHTYPHSWFPSYPADNPEKPEYNDQHNLYPVKQVNVNEVRCNYPMGEVLNPVVQYSGIKLGADAKGNTVFEPRDGGKGSAARAMMYMAVCYNSSSQNWGFKNPIGQCLTTPINYGQDQYIIKKWHFQFPPSAMERARNDFLDSVQQNRNPFTDSIRYACFINFSNMTKWQPAVVLVGNELQTEPGVEFEWYLNGTPIAGATGQNYTPTQNGTYSVKVRQFSACPSIQSADIQVTNAGLESPSAAELKIFPNPSGKQFFVEFENPGYPFVTLNIYDMTGMQVITARVAVSGGKNVIPVQHTLSSGTYLVDITHGNERISSTRVIVN